MSEINQRFIDRIVANAQNSAMGLGDPKSSYSIDGYAEASFETVAMILVTAHVEKYDLISLMRASMEVLHADHLQALTTITAERDAAVKERDEARRERDSLQEDLNFEWEFRAGLGKQLGRKDDNIVGIELAIKVLLSNLDTARAALAEAGRERDEWRKRAETNEAGENAERQRCVQLAADRDRLSAELEEARKDIKTAIGLLEEWMRNAACLCAVDSEPFGSCEFCRTRDFLYPSPGNPTKEPTAMSNDDLVHRRVQQPPPTES